MDKKPIFYRTGTIKPVVNETSEEAIEIDNNTYCLMNAYNELGYKLNRILNKM